MLRIQRKFVESCLLIMLLVSLFLLASFRTSGQEPPNSQAARDGVASNKVVEVKDPSDAVIGMSPVYQDFMGVTLGMSTEEVRAKLGDPNDKGERQDFFVFSNSQSAQVVYDDQGKLVVISVDYVGKDGNSPSPESVLGEAVQAKQDGSIYQLKRYPEAGYWVAYSRTAGDNPLVTVTMQKL